MQISLQQAQLPCLIRAAFNDQALGGQYLGDATKIFMDRNGDKKYQLTSN
jgi:hypothetical protein